MLVLIVFLLTAQFPFRWIYYGCNKSTGKETGKTHLFVHCTMVTGQISLSLGVFVYADEPPLAIYLPIPKYLPTRMCSGPYFLKSQVSFRPQFNDSKAKIDDGISSSSPPCFT